MAGEVERQEVQGLPLEPAVGERWQVIGQSAGDMQQGRQEELEL